MRSFLCVCELERIFMRNIKSLPSISSMKNAFCLLWVSVTRSPQVILRDILDASKAMSFALHFSSCIWNWYAHLARGTISNPKWWGENSGRCWRIPYFRYTLVLRLAWHSPSTSVSHVHLVHALVCFCFPFLSRNAYVIFFSDQVWACSVYVLWIWYWYRNEWLALY